MNGKISIRSKSTNKAAKKSTATKDSTMKKSATIKKAAVAEEKKKTKTLNTSKSKDKIQSKKKADKEAILSTLERESTASNASDVKISKNVDTISRLINNSNEILAQQNSLLEKCEEVTKKITSSDFEIERLMNKNENDDFPVFLDKYGSKLNHIIAKLKNHTDEVEAIKYVQEENKNLKYKLELMSIDKSESGLQYESKYISLRNFIINEFNNLNESLADLGYDYLYHKFSNNNFGEEGIAIFVTNLQKLLKDCKLKSAEKENEATTVNYDKKNLEGEIQVLKGKLEEMKRSVNKKGNITENYNKTMEEDLYYYKNLVRDYERQIEELKRGNNQLSSSMNNNAEKYQYDKERKYQNDNYDNQSQQNYENKNYQNQNYQNYEEDQNNNQSQYNNQYQYNAVASLANNSLEGFRRNKDLRVSILSNPLLTEENMRLENKYSDSYFYKPEVKSQYDYLNSQHSIK